LTSTGLWLTSVQWTLATTFDLRGWFFSKLGLALALLHWTTRFIYSDDIGSIDGRQKERDYFVVLVEYLRKDAMTKKVREIFI
jgi:hypothetical protein